MSDDDISGYDPVKTKTRYSAVFAAGITIAHGVDKTVERIGVYFGKRECAVKYVRCVRENGHTMSVKIVLASHAFNFSPEVPVVLRQSRSTQ